MLGQAAFWREGSGQDLFGITPQAHRSLKDGPVESGLPGIVTNGYQPRTWRLWTLGFGGSSSLHGDAGSGSTDLFARTAGLAVGFDYQIDRAALVGIAGGYTNSRFSVDQGATSGTVEGGHVGLYSVQRLGPLYLASTAEYAHYYNVTDRFVDWVVDERAQGQFESETYSARMETGWRRSFGNYQVTPFAGLQVSHLVVQRFTEESVGILGLTFDSRSVVSLASSLGIQVDARTEFANGRALTPFARLAWVHEFNPDRVVAANLTLSPAATFSPAGASSASDAAKLTTGLKLDITNKVALFGYFDGEFSEHSRSYTGNGGVRISW